MNIESLKMFCFVVEEGSISKAARKGYVSQPAVSKQIHHLEQSYKTLLFNRSDNKLSLTDAGTILYEYAKEIVTYYNRSQEALSRDINNLEMNLNVGASLTIGEYILPKLLGEYMSKYKSIKFTLSLGNTSEMIKKLKNNNIDVALVEGLFENAKAFTDKLLEIEKFADDELILVTSNNHRWANIGEIELKDLSEEKMIWREPTSGTRRILENVLMDNGVLNKIDSFMELGSVQSIKSSVEAGLGVSILPKLSVERELEYGSLCHIKISNFEINRTLYLVQKNHRFQKYDVVNFVEFIRSKNCLIFKE